MAVSSDAIESQANISAACRLSHTGWQVSWNGLAGLALAWEEGLEFHVLGTTIGIDPLDLAIKLPSFGRLGLLR